MPIAENKAKWKILRPMQQSDVSWKVYQLKKKKQTHTLKSNKVFMEEDKLQNKCLDTDSFYTTKIQKRYWKHSQFKGAIKKHKTYKNKHINIYKNLHSKLQKLTKTKNKLQINVEI